MTDPQNNLYRFQLYVFYFIKHNMTLFFTMLSVFSFWTCKIDVPEYVAPKIINIHEKAKEAKAFCVANQLSTSYCILIDYSIHSGKKRLFVYDFTKDSVVATGMVSHGCGNHLWGMDETKTSPTFSNVEESHLSSLGKYKIGTRGYSSWGININYKLHGLEASNSKAYKRVIVLHSWDDIPHEEVYPQGTPEGWGCPAVSNEFMKYLDDLLKNSSKPVLMWVYNE